jgi:hypothetical protein
MKVTTLAIFVLGCSASRESTLSVHGDAMADHLAVLREAVETHSDRIDAAIDLAAMREEELAHTEVAMKHLDWIERHVEDMGMCKDDHGMGPDLEMLEEIRDDCVQEVQAHADTMQAASDRDAAYAEELRHQDAMHLALDRMDSMDSAMIEMIGDSVCPDDSN